MNSSVYPSACPSASASVFASGVAPGSFSLSTLQEKSCSPYFGKLGPSESNCHSFYTSTSTLACIPASVIAPAPHFSVTAQPQSSLQNEKPVTANNCNSLGITVFASGSAVSQTQIPHHHHHHLNWEQQEQIIDSNNNNSSSNSNHSLHSVMAVDMTSLLTMLQDLVLSQPCRKCNKHTVLLHHVNSTGCSPSFFLKCNNPNCDWKYKFDLSPSWNGPLKMKEIPIRVMASFMLSGLTFEKYNEVLRFIDLHPSASHTWTKLMKILYNEANNHLQGCLQNNCNKILDSNLILVSDAGWSHLWLVCK